MLNQSIISGIGNIYKSESLFEAGIHPERPIQSLSMQEKDNLAEAIVAVIDKALKYGGSTFGGGLQRYIRPNGQIGEAQQWHMVYGRKDQPCKKCGEMIIRIVQNGRSTFICENCQK